MITKFPITILDCYTDEPSGLGVPPYLGTYPRYLFGALENPNYITIDDLRMHVFYNDFKKEKQKTDIRVHNLTNNYKNIKQILEKTEKLIVIGGIHTPGKYLTAVPGTFYEMKKLISELNCEKILTGPAVYGTRLEGGKEAEKTDLSFFDKIEADYLGINDYENIKEFSIKGAEIVKQVPWTVMAELESAKGCKYGQCSFCTEPLKNKPEKRDIKDIINEAIALNKLGVKHFRLGKQSDFFDRSETEIEMLLKEIKNDCNPKTMHIDNVDPVSVTEEKVKLVVKYCTPGNVAALGCESFDPEVIKANKLHSSPEASMKAIRTINKFGAERGENGMPKFLPGINIIFGLKNETKQTHEQNIKYLGQIMEEGLLLRRINIRQVVVFPGTAMEECKTKFLHKNKKYYWKWRNEIRQKIDNEMLKRVLPVGTVLRDVFMEVYDGNHTFGRQFGTYPLVVGVNKRIELNKKYDIKVTGHMLRSVTGEAI
jgi:radical SAM superfamily enzyme with C-terminal helix-hairpin-helix motif